jgi:hypothetical protein
MNKDAYDLQMQLEGETSSTQVRDGRIKFIFRARNRLHNLNINCSDKATLESGNTFITSNLGLCGFIEII